MHEENWGGNVSVNFDDCSPLVPDLRRLLPFFRGSMAEVPLKRCPDKNAVLRCIDTT